MNSVPFLKQTIILNVAGRRTEFLPLLAKEGGGVVVVNDNTKRMRFGISYSKT
jgi:hypothetical protein